MENSYSKIISLFVSGNLFLKSFDTEKTKAFFPHKVTQNMLKYYRENPSLIQHKGDVIEILRNSKIQHKH